MRDDGGGGDVEEGGLALGRDRPPAAGTRARPHRKGPHMHSSRMVSPQTNSPKMVPREKMSERESTSPPLPSSGAM